MGAVVYVLVMLGLLISIWPPVVGPIVGALVLWAVIAIARSSYRDRKRGWRVVGGPGRDHIRYQEWHNGKWEGFEIYAEIITHGRAINLGAIPDWKTGLPGYATREEIIARLQMEFPPPKNWLSYD